MSFRCVFEFEFNIGITHELTRQVSHLPRVEEGFVARFGKEIAALRAAGRDDTDWDIQKLNIIQNCEWRVAFVQHVMTGDALEAEVTLEEI